MDKQAVEIVCESQSVNGRTNTYIVTVGDKGWSIWYSEPVGVDLQGGERIRDWAEKGQVGPPPANRYMLVPTQIGYDHRNGECLELSIMSPCVDESDPLPPPFNLKGPIPKGAEFMLTLHNSPSPRVYTRLNYVWFPYAANFHPEFFKTQSKGPMWVVDADENQETVAGALNVKWQQAASCPDTIHFRPMEPSARGPIVRVEASDWIEVAHRRFPRLVNFYAPWRNEDDTLVATTRIITIQAVLAPQTFLPTLPAAKINAFDARLSGDSTAFGLANYLFTGPQIPSLSDPRLKAATRRLAVEFGAVAQEETSRHWWIKIAVWTLIIIAFGVISKRYAHHWKKQK